MIPLFGPDRSGRPDDRFLVWKVRLFAAGATLGLAGIFVDLQPLVWAGVGVLVAGFFLRFLPSSGVSESDEG